MGEQVEPNWIILEQLMTAPKSQLSTGMVSKLKVLKGKPVEEVRSGLHEILDFCARDSLASDFVMQILDYEWHRLGGQADKHYSDLNSAEEAVTALRKQFFTKEED